MTGIIYPIFNAISVDATLAPDSVSNWTSWRNDITSSVRVLAFPFPSSIPWSDSRLFVRWTSRKQGIRRERKAGAMTTTRRIEIRNFYMCPNRIDFRICRQYLPSAAPSTFQLLVLSHFPNYEVPRHSEERIKVLREWGKREAAKSIQGESL